MSNAAADQRSKCARLDFTRTFARIDEVTRQYNATAPRNLLIKAPHIALLRELIRMLAYDRQTYYINPDQRYFIDTNRGRLADRLQCSPRSIYNYLERLKAARLISVTFRGTRSNFYIHLTPGLLYQGMSAADLSTGSAAVENMAVGAILDTYNRQTLPLTGDTGNTNKTLNRAVEIVETTAIPGDQSGATISVSDNQFTGYTGGNGPIIAPVQNTGGNVSPGAKKPLAPGEIAHILAYVVPLFAWLEAHVFNRLKYLADQQRAAGIAHLFRYFAEAQHGDYQRVNRNLQVRAELVREWLERDPARYVPIPEKYLDPGNPGGFTRTLQWYRKMENDTVRMKAAADRLQDYRKQYRLFDRAIKAYYQDPHNLANYRATITHLRRINPALVDAFNAHITNNVTELNKAI